jgi:glycosyltransferase involved in cell wall biosynthesis
MSNSILEAMAVERPVIVTDIPPNRGLVVPEESGFMISYDDDKEFISCLEKLLDPDVRRQKGKFNRQRVVDNFSLEARLNKELAIYKKVKDM